MSLHGIGPEPFIRPSNSIPQRDCRLPASRGAELRVISEEDLDIGGTQAIRVLFDRDAFGGELALRGRPALEGVDGVQESHGE